jgi:hypothetical protein
LLFGAIASFVGALLTVVLSLVGGPVWDDWILDERAVEVDAQALGVRGTSSTRGNWERIHLIRFRFVDLEGVPHEAEGPTTDQAVIEKARMLEEVAIEYDPRAPARGGRDDLDHLRSSPAGAKHRGANHRGGLSRLIAALSPVPAPRI